ncbi:MAG TPA: ZPR1 zinc finger domain-containing protein [archaeon]|mgnify:CR=1 FL=1|nr:ZPR1 zinc finger domain-containing protein [archaeon]
MICPVCKGPLTVTVKEQKDFLGGQLTLVSMVCGRNGCPYRTLDILPQEGREPSRLTFEVKSEKDLNVLVARSSTARVIIPEIGATIEPGTASLGFITTIEGVLQRFVTHVREPRARRLVKELLKGKPFTIIIEDPYGNSGINSDRAVAELML